MSTPLPPNVPAESKNQPVASSTWLSPNSVFADAPQGQVKRAAGATAASIVFHVLLVLLITFLLTRPTPLQVVEPRRPLATLVYLEQAGPGGGGGGSPAPAPPRPIEIPRTEAPAPIPLEVPPPVVPPPPPTLSAPVMTSNAVNFQATGESSISLASYGGGGRGTGLGAGTGSGVGEGTGGGFGGGAYRMGAGITNPVLLRQSKPTYTSEAMRAKIQGQVWLEAVVLEDGTVGDVRVTRSLDRVYGLDQAAMEAAKTWLFRPATNREGQAVPIIVTLELTFTIH